MARFLAELKARQGQDQDKEFAEKLGISPSYWTRVRLEQRAVSLRLARLAIALWPDLEPLYVADIRDGLKARSADRFSAATKRAS